MREQQPYPCPLKESRIVTVCVEVSEWAVWWSHTKIGTSEIV